MPLNFGNTLFDQSQRDTFGTGKLDYINIPGVAFNSRDLEVDNVQIDGDEGTFINQAAPTIYTNAPVILPHGSTIISCTMWGAGTWNWGIARNELAGSIVVEEVISSTAKNTQGVPDTAAEQKAAVIDNIKYVYWISVFSLPQSGVIYGATIEYMH